MKESALIKKFQRNFLKEFPGALWYKIPDTHGLGGLRPFDVIIFCKGKTFALEFKSKNGILTLHQAYYLGLAQKNRIAAYVVREDDWKTQLMRIRFDITGEGSVCP